MQIEYSGNIEGLEEAAAFVTKLFDDERFWAAIEEHGDYYLAKLEPHEIVSQLRAGPQVIHMRDFTPSGFWQRRFYRNTVAKVEGSNPARFGYSTKERFANRSVGQKVNTIVHEYVHLTDNTNGIKYEQMGHGGNRSRGKERTAPFGIGAIAQRMYEAAKGQPEESLPEGVM